MSGWIIEQLYSRTGAGNWNITNEQSRCLVEMYGGCCSIVFSTTFILGTGNSWYSVEISRNWVNGPRSTDGLGGYPTHTLTHSLTLTLASLMNLNTLRGYISYIFYLLTLPCVYFFFYDYLCMFFLSGRRNCKRKRRRKKNYVIFINDDSFH